MKLSILLAVALCASALADDFEYLGRKVKNPCFLFSEKGDFIVCGTDTTWNRLTKVTLPWNSAELRMRSGYARTRDSILAGTSAKSVPVGDIKHHGYTFANAALWKHDADFAFFKTASGILAMPWRDVEIPVQEKLGNVSPHGKMKALGAWRAANDIQNVVGEITQVIEGGFLLMEDRTFRIYHVAGKTQKAQGDRVSVDGKRNGNFTYTTVLLADATVPSLMPVRPPDELLK